MIRTMSSTSSSDSPQTYQESMDWSLSAVSDENLLESFFVNPDLDSVVPQTSNGKVKKIRNVKKSKKYHCSVCGDAPTGYHYDVLSCNGCKTFFRRTIISNRSFECMKGGNCQFTKDFRCSCRACRFAKCIRVGMNRKAIQYPSTDLVKKTVEIKTEFMETRQWDSSALNMRLMDEVLQRENHIRKYRRIDCPVVGMEPTLDEILDDRYIFSRSDQMQNANQVIYKKNPVKYWMITDLFLVVEFAKTFQPFWELSRADQRVMLGHVGGSLHVCTQAFYSYFEKKNLSLTFPDGVNAKRLREIEMYENERTCNNPCVSPASMRKAFLKYFSEVYSLPIVNVHDLKMTPEEHSIFKAICLFSPEKIEKKTNLFTTETHPPTFTDETEMSEAGKRIVQEEREKHVFLLRNHIFATYDTREAVQRFATALMLVTTFKGYGEKRRNYLEMMHFLQFNLCELAKDIYFRHQKSNWKTVADELCLFLEPTVLKDIKTDVVEEIE